MLRERVHSACSIIRAAQLYPRGALLHGTGWRAPSAAQLMLNQPCTAGLVQHAASTAGAELAERAKCRA